MVNYKIRIALAGKLQGAETMGRKKRGLLELRASVPEPPGAADKKEERIRGGMRKNEFLCF